MIAKIVDFRITHTGGIYYYYDDFIIFDAYI